VLIDF